MKNTFITVKTLKAIVIVKDSQIYQLKKMLKECKEYIVELKSNNR